MRACVCVCVCVRDHRLTWVYVYKHINVCQCKSVDTYVHLGLPHESVTLTVCACVYVCAIEPSSSSVSGLKRLWDEWEQRIKERLHVWPCIILDILNAAFVEMGTAYKKWHCAAAERACGLNSMTNLSPRIILFNLPPTLCLRHFCYTQYLWVEWTILKIFKRRLLGPMRREDKKKRSLCFSA